MKSRIWATCLLSGSTFCVLAGDTESSLPSFIEVDVGYSELRGECTEERFVVAIFNTGDGRHTGSITDVRGNLLYQGVPVHAEGCGGDVWPQRTDAFEKLGTLPSGETILQLVIRNSTSKTCHAVLDLPAIVGNLCAPPNPGILR